MKKILATILAAALAGGAWGDASVATQSDLNSAVAAASAGDTVTITVADTYTLPGVPQNITIEGGVDGVMFSHTGGGNIASIPNGATFKNVSFTFGNADYHGFQHAGKIVMDGCTLNGKLFSYGDMEFTNCQFVQSDGDYNMWCYSGNCTYTGCTFTNQLKSKFLNIYNESGATRYTVKVTNCTFVNNGSSSKAALNVKATCGTTPLNYAVIIDSCSTEGNFPAASESDSLVVKDSLLQIDDRNASVASKIVAAEGTNIVLDESGNIASGTLTAYYKDEAAAPVISEESQLVDNGNGTYTVRDPNAPVPQTFSVQSSNLFGSIKVTGVASNMYVAVPFEGFGGAARQAKDVVHAANLTEGTRMYVYDRTADKYDVFDVDSNGQWSAAPKATINADGKTTFDEADLTRAVEVGTGVLVERKDKTEDVYVYGEIPTGEAAPVSFNAGQTLVSAPSTNAMAEVNLNAFTWTGVAAAASGRLKTSGADYIQFRDANNNLIRYFYLADGGWGLAPTQARKYPELVADGKALIPAGTAFWYWSKNGGAQVTW